MDFLPKALLLLLLAVIYVELGEVVANKVPDRCWCLDSVVPRARKENIEEFWIFPKRPNCQRVEIILKRKPENNTTKATEICLNPDKHQGKVLQTCWNSKKTNNTFTMKMSECFN